MEGFYVKEIVTIAGEVVEIFVTTEELSAIKNFILRYQKNKLDSRVKSQKIDDFKYQVNLILEEGYRDDNMVSLIIEHAEQLQEDLNK